MSRNLQIFAGQQTGDTIKVHWRIDGSDKQRVINVNIPADIEDKPVIAELCALNYLLRTRNIFGADKVPKNEVVSVSHGAIKRLWNQDTEKSHLIKWGRFLYPAIGDGRIDVVKSHAWTREFEVVDEVHIEAAPPDRYTVHVTSLNIDVALTRHAVERYQERRETATATKAMQSIRKLMGGGSLRELSMSEHRTLKKALKHGKTAKYLIHIQTGIVFVLVPEEDGWSLVTILDDEREGGLTRPVLVGGRIEYRYD